MIYEVLDKYSDEVISRLNNDNMYKILDFLGKEDCNYIEDILEDYLDLFTIEYEKFVEKYNFLNEKYNNKLLELASSDMNIFEEFFD